MNTCTLSPNGFVTALSASVVVAVSAWAFVSSTATIERDPFQFASIMAANAKVSIAQLPNRTVSACPNDPEPWDPVCVRG